MLSVFAYKTRLSIVNNETQLLYICGSMNLIEQKSVLTRDISCFVLDKYLLHVSTIQMILSTHGSNSNSQTCFVFYHQTSELMISSGDTVQLAWPLCMTLMIRKYRNIPTWHMCNVWCQEMSIKYFLQTLKSKTWQILLIVFLPFKAQDQTSEWQDHERKHQLMTDQCRVTCQYTSPCQITPMSTSILICHCNNIVSVWRWVDKV